MQQCILGNVHCDVLFLGCQHGQIYLSHCSFKLPKLAKVFGLFKIQNFFLLVRVSLFMASLADLA